MVLFFQFLAVIIIVFILQVIIGIIAFIYREKVKYHYTCTLLIAFL